MDFSNKVLQKCLTITVHQFVRRRIPEGRIKGTPCHEMGNGNLFQAFKMCSRHARVSFPQSRIGHAGNLRGPCHVQHDTIRFRVRAHSRKGNKI